MIPKPTKREIIRSYKISKRMDLDISTVSAAFRLALKKDNTVKKIDIVYGGMAENVKAMNGTGVVFADTTINEIGLYGYIQQILAERLTLNTGLRYQHHSVYGVEWIPAAGFAYKFDESFSWKGNISKGFRSPTLKELYMWGTQNPDLKPESIMNYETGFLKTFLDNKISAELTFFTVSGDNLITTVPLNGTVKFMNSGKVSNKGIEFALNAEATDNLVINGTYSYINMKHPVYATPEHQIYLNARYRLKNIQLTGSILRIINLDNDPSSVVNEVEYTLLKAKAIYHIAKNINVYVSGENLLNQKYQVNRYYTMPGITVFTGMNFSF